LRRALRHLGASLNELHGSSCGAHFKMLYKHFAEISFRWEQMLK
jgi:hypothetical protein